VPAGELEERREVLVAEDVDAVADVEHGGSLRCTARAGPPHLIGRSWTMPAREPARPISRR
jgi:hypothetical protein